MNHKTCSAKLSDAEWQSIRNLLSSTESITQISEAELRSVTNTVVHIKELWKDLPDGTPNPALVCRYFIDWKETGVLLEIEKILNRNTSQICAAKLSDAEWQSIRNLLSSTELITQISEAELRNVTNTVIYIKELWKALTDISPNQQLVCECLVDWEERGVLLEIEKILNRKIRHSRQWLPSLEILLIASWIIGLGLAWMILLLQ